MLDAAIIFGYAAEAVCRKQPVLLLTLCCSLHRMCYGKHVWEVGVGVEGHLEHLQGKGEEEPAYQICFNGLL